MRLGTTVLFSGIVLATAQIAAAIEPNPTVYVQPGDGFDSYITAAIVKKKVPIRVTQSKEDATYVLTDQVEQKEESGASKIARCLFAYCIGIEGTQTATVRLVNSKTGEVVWAYNVRKQGSKNFQSSAEAIAKHLKRYMEGAGY